MIDTYVCYSPMTDIINMSLWWYYAKRLEYVIERLMRRPISTPFLKKVFFCCCCFFLYPSQSQFISYLMQRLSILILTSSYDHDNDLYWPNQFLLRPLKQRLILNWQGWDDAMSAVRHSNVYSFQPIVFVYERIS